MSATMVPKRVLAHKVIMRQQTLLAVARVALEAQQAAINELMTEFVSKTRAAKWDIINEAGVRARAVLAKMKEDAAKGGTP